MNPLWYPLLLVIPLAIVAGWLRAYPQWRLVYLAAIPLVVTLLIAVGLPALFWPLIALDILLVVVAALDLATAPRPQRMQVERHLVRIASLGKPHPVSLTVTNPTGRACRLELRDDVPQELVADPEEFTVTIPPVSRATVAYELKARRRGAFRLERVYLRSGSWLGLWQRLGDVACENDVYVYPDLKQLAEYAVLARTNRLSMVGVRRTRKIGLDNEFERLRDYTLDDNHKHIDWRSTARRNKLTVKDFQANQSQRIVFLVDCGRMMTNESAGASLLDHAFNALLMMSYVALRQGDSVGMVTFSDDIHGYVPPRGGMSQMNRLLHASFDRFPRLVESNYEQAFLFLAGECRKRALVVLITNVIDEVNARQIEQYLSNLRGRHLPLGVLLRDHRLFDAADHAPAQGRDLYRAAAAADIVLWRKQTLADLLAQGVLIVDAFPEALTGPLVNRYLEIKARHLL